MGKYEIYKDSSGHFRFRLKAANGEIIATSQAYTTKAGALGGIASVKKNANAPTVDLT
ncbi:MULTISPECIES: YegP family protein [unclassified Microbacterium]|uniref:YegP family protein n=1 Tax=unclassified Microbacterium TaxID=2609290 RepID=UPI00341DFC6E